MSPASRGRQQTGKLNALCSLLSCDVRNGASSLAVRGESCALPETVPKQKSVLALQ